MFLCGQKHSEKSPTNGIALEQIDDKGVGCTVGVCSSPTSVTRIRFRGRAVDES